MTGNDSANSLATFALIDAIMTQKMGEDLRFGDGYEIKDGKFKSHAESFVACFENDEFPKNEVFEENELYDKLVEHWKNEKELYINKPNYVIMEFPNYPN